MSELPSGASRGPASAGQAPSAGAFGEIATGVAAALLLVVAALLPFTDPRLLRAGPSRWGVLVALLGVAAGAAAVLRGTRWLAAIGGGAIGVALVALVHLGLADPAFWTLADQNDDYGTIAELARQERTYNTGLDPDFRRTLVIDGLDGRLRTALLFAGRGLWLTAAGGALAAGAALLARPRAAATPAAVGLGLVLLAGLPALAGHLGASRSEIEGDRELAAGRFDAAIAHYRDAQERSAQAAHDAVLQLRIGEALARSGLVEAPEALLHRGHALELRGEEAEAAAAYGLALAGGSEAVRRTAARRLGRLHLAAGLRRELLGDVPAARTCFERAVGVDGADSADGADGGALVAAYALARAELELGRFRQSIATSERLLARIGNPLVQAHLFMTIGDASFRLHELDAARRAYARAYERDRDSNYGALRRLGGT